MNTDQILNIYEYEYEYEYGYISDTKLKYHQL
jgi:hypothetical protein